MPASVSLLQPRHRLKNLLFVADDTSGLLTYRLASPGTPALISQFPSGSAVGEVAVEGNLVLMGTLIKGSSSST